MKTYATTTAPISGLLTLVSALEQASNGTPTGRAVSAPLDLSSGLGEIVGGWMAVKDDGQGWVVLQFAPHATTGSPRVETPATQSRPVPARPDFGARARRVHTALTDREREVLCLVAGGATNQAIGQHLFISPKTASVHVSRILTKLDARTRTEAAALAHASGLVRPWGTVESAADTRPIAHAIGA